MTATRKLRAGLYELVGVFHTRPRFPGAPVCGGQIRVEDMTEYDREGEPTQGWESHCVVCGECDFNGYDTLKECAANSPGYFCEGAA